jgi:hypothetical protein
MKADYRPGAVDQATAFREGNTLVYVPVAKDPRDLALTFGPIGYAKVEAIEECPLAVRPGPAGRFHPVRVADRRTCRHR